MKDSKLFRNRVIFLFDMLGIIILYILSVLFVEGAKELTLNISKFVPIAFFVFVSICGLYFENNIYHILWPFAGTKDYIKICLCAITGCLLSGILTLVLRYAFADKYIHEIRNMFRICILTAAMVSVYTVFIRMIIRVMLQIPAAKDVALKDDENAPQKKKVIIVGAGVAATILIKDMYTNQNLNFEIIGFVDDNPEKQGSIICGYTVLGDRNQIPSLCKKHEIDQIIIAMPSASTADKNEIMELCTKTKAKVKIMPAVDETITSPNQVKKLYREVRIEDLLDRNIVDLDNKEISNHIEGKVVLVTGGGGSIGSELCRQIMKYNPKKLVVVDIYENNAYDLQMELNRHYPDNMPEVIIASVRDKDRLEAIFEKYKPYIVFHAAAHKHVPLMEKSPSEAIKNNVFGTFNVAMCADKYKAHQFVLISTDKAVNPTNIMGATKRVCEMIIQGMQKISDTVFVAVRFGNVLGSNGSVIPLFKKQIEEGGPVTVTHKDITRFFMTIPEAAQLVLQAASYAKDGEIFVLDMGKPVKIYDLAKNVIRLSGYTPGTDIKIEVTGLRPGEKLYEELLMSEEGLKKTRHEKIFIGSPLDITMEELKPNLELLKKASETNNVEEIKNVIEKVVPTYIRNSDEVNAPDKNTVATTV